MRKMWAEKIEQYLSEQRPVSGGSNLEIALPSIYFVSLFFGAAGGFPTAGTGFIDNFPVKLPKKYTRVCKLTTDDATSWPINNIFLHFNYFTDALGGTNPSTGRLLQLGGQPYVFPLEFGAQSKSLRVFKFPCGIPVNCFLSADFQGTGNHTDIIAFFNDDFDLDFVYTQI